MELSFWWFENKHSFLIKSMRKTEVSRSKANPLSFSYLWLSKWKCFWIEINKAEKKWTDREKSIIKKLKKKLGITSLLIAIKDDR